MASAPEPQPLPPVNRYITTHTASGQATWDTSIPVQVPSVRHGGFTMHTSFVNQHSPHDMNNDQDLHSYKQNAVETDLFPASGSVLRVVDLWPGYPAWMHRTGSVDYGIVIEGEVQCYLDDGSSRTFGRGDIIVQRGTNHAWKNTGTGVARICFTLLATPPVKVNGKELELNHLS